MKVLDCESVVSTLRSLGILFGCDESQVKDVLKNVDYGAWQCEQEINGMGFLDWDSYLKNAVVEKLGEPCAPDAVCWFHGTRVFNPDAYLEHGLLPLGDVIDSIWEGIMDIVNGTVEATRIRRLQRSEVINSSYDLKVNGGVDPGPFALSNRESVLSSKNDGHHSYIDLPEIVNDICDGFLERFEYSIHDLIRKKTTPCIVKFKKNNTNEMRRVFVACDYVRFMLSGGGELPFGTYDGERYGPVSVDEIQSVERLKLR